MYILEDNKDRVDRIANNIRTYIADCDQSSGKELPLYRVIDIANHFNCWKPKSIDMVISSQAA